MTLSQFLLRLVADPELLARFTNDPEGVAREFDLDPRKLQLLGAAQIESLRVEIRAEIETEGESATVIWLHHVPWLWKADGPEAS
jgi:hypothetical protein